MSRDGSLRVEFRKHLRDAQWTSIETGLTEGGVPDSEYMFKGGIGGWIEFKKTATNAVGLRPLQIAWLSRRARLGGRCFVAVLHKKDTLFLFHGKHVAALKSDGICGTEALGVWTGGIAKWDWDMIRKILMQSPCSA